MPKPDHLLRHRVCGARTRRHGVCQQPAMANARCRLHGGLSTGARTPEGRERSRFARWVHGNRSAPSVAALRAYRAFLRNAAQDWTGDDDETISTAHEALLRCQLLDYRADLVRSRANQLGKHKRRNIRLPVYPFPTIPPDQREALEAEIMGEQNKSAFQNANERNLR